MSKFIKITDEKRTIWVNVDEIAFVVKKEESQCALIVLKHEALGVGLPYNKMVWISPADYEKIMKMITNAEN